MRIGINLTQLFPGQIGGTETYVRGLLQALPGVDGTDDYRLFCLSDNGVDLDVARFRKTIVARSRRHPAGLAQWAARKALWAVARYDWVGQRLRRESAGLAVMHYPFSTLWPPPAVAPSVVTMHDIQHEYHPEFFSPRELAFRRAHYPAAARAAARIIAVSEFTRQTIIKKYAVDPRRVVTIPYGLDNALFGAAHSPARLAEANARYALPDRFVFYPANGWAHKNHQRLFEAMKLLKDEGRLAFRLVLAGAQYPGQVDLRSRARALGLDGDVAHLGHIPHDEVALMYAQALGLAFPSLYEGFGSPVLEAMAAGCPVLASTAGSLPEVAGDAALLVDPRDTAALADGLHRLTEDTALREALAARGRRRAAEFSWLETARRTVAVYHEAAA
jgi:glycosyltransferase involved in cell wall biosynthesis